MHLSFKYIIGYSLLSCLMLACETAPKTDGVWVLAYTIDKEGKKAHSAQKTLFDFEGDSLSVIHVGNQQTGEIAGTYLFAKALLEKNPWRYRIEPEGSSDLILSLVSKDSLVLGPSDAGEQIVLKPISHYIHKPFRPAKLVGKAFKSTVPGISHTLDFADSTYMINLLGDYTERVTWSLISYKGHQFLNSNSFYLLQSIEHDTNGNIILTNQYTSTNANSYTQVVPKYKKEQLYGNWLVSQGISTVLNASGANKKIGLSIGHNYFNRHHEDIYPQMTEWKLSNDGQHIYQINDKTIPYKIIDLTDTTLSLKYYINTDTILSEEVFKRLSSNFITKYKRGDFD